MILFILVKYILNSPVSSRFFIFATVYFVMNTNKLFLKFVIFKFVFNQILSIQDSVCKQKHGTRFVYKKEKKKEAPYFANLRLTLG